MALSEVAKRRLTALIDFMEKLPPEAGPHFSMHACWASHTGPHPMQGEVSQDSLMDCGTKACAFGWAGAVPSLRAEGLKINWTEIKKDHFVASSGADDGMEFFDITRDQFWLLFNDDHMDNDTSPQAWAMRARDLVKDWR
jgi:hypothetical protein